MRVSQKGEEIWEGSKEAKIFNFDVEYEYDVEMREKKGYFHLYIARVTMKI